MSSPKARVKTGVLLVNTGTPDEPTVDGVRAFLTEMLSDPMLVSMPRPLWNIILKKCILPRRPQRTVRAYQEMWTADGAPFLLTSYKQRDLVASELERRAAKEDEAAPGAWQVELAMRYGNPSIARGLEALRTGGCGRVVTPGFVADNIETCIEIGRTLRESFLKEARRFGTTAPRFTRVPALNDAPGLAKAVADAICDATCPR